MMLYLGSVSKVKYEAINEVINEYLKEVRKIFGEPKVIPNNVESGVDITPVNEETYIGAKNRAYNLYKLIKDENSAYLGLESGLAQRFGSIFEETVCVILFKGMEYVGYSSGIKVPDYIVKRLENGEKHYEVLSEIARRRGLNPKDTWGIYTNLILSRKIELKEAFRNALLTLISEFL
jgi:non-canonical (house-cleaning) NTP pyrophosphatase